MYLNYFRLKTLQPKLLHNFCEDHKLKYVFFYFGFSIKAVLRYVKCFGTDMRGTQKQVKMPVRVKSVKNSKQKDLIKNFTSKIYL